MWLNILRNFSSLKFKIVCFVYTIELDDLTNILFKVEIEKQFSKIVLLILISTIIKAKQVKTKIIKTNSFNESLD